MTNSRSSGRWSEQLPKQLLAGLLFFTLWLAGCSKQNQHFAGPQADAQGHLRYGQITFTPCSLKGTAQQGVQAQCANVEVAENPTDPDGRKITLALAMISAEGIAEADPVFMLAGGPGQSALESYPSIQTAFANVLRNRNILLLDARGTGGSNLLQCDMPADDDSLFDARYQTPEAILAQTTSCRDKLAQTADLRYYTTAEHIADLDFIRSQLGVERVNLVGISYGTRVAQQYAATYPTHVRALVLDSVVPNTLVLGSEHARNLEDALNRQFERCRTDSACQNQLGNPAEQLVRVRRHLQTQNLSAVRYRDPVNGSWRKEVPSFAHLSGLLRMYAYQPAMAATLPLLLHEAAQERYQSLLAQSRLLAQDLGNSIAMGMSLSVTCTEDGDEFDPDSHSENTILGTEFIDNIQISCSVWPRGKRSANFRTPLSGNIPVLAISGEFDPVTPPRYGDEVIAHLSAGLHLVLPGQGHSVLGTGCMPRLFAQFIETADVGTLDASCLQRLSAQAPFAGNYGWEP
ncbi:MAG: alpha/beta hydrolase [Parahaliea sp.]